MVLYHQCPDRKEEPMRKAWKCRKLFQVLSARNLPLSSGSTPHSFPNTVDLQSLRISARVHFYKPGPGEKKRILWRSLSVGTLQEGGCHSAYHHRRIGSQGMYSPMYSWFSMPSIFCSTLLLEATKQECSLMQWKVFDWHILYFTLVLSLSYYSYS